MANTNTLTRTLTGLNKVVHYVCIVSDGTEETDLVIHDSSVVATALGVVDPLMCSIQKIHIATTATVAARLRLEFDADTDVCALAIPSSFVGTLDFQHIGNLKNTSGTGITGDITLTTTGLESGDVICFVLEVQPR